jgi:hypothetical protein
MQSASDQGSIKAEDQPILRCARCGIESAERTCFIVPGRHGRPPHDIRCVTCEQRRLTPSTTYAIFVVVGTIVWPLMLLEVVSGGRELDLWTVLFALFLSPVAIIAHELGHAGTAYLIGLKVAAIGIGSGRVVGTFELGGLPIRLHMWPMSGRVYVGASSTHSLRIRLWIMTLMGPMTNILLAVATGIYWHPLESLVGSPAVNLWFVVSILLAGINLIPQRVNDLGRAVSTDGLALLSIPRLSAEQLSAYLIAVPLTRALCRYEAGNYSGASDLLTAAIAQAPENTVLRVMQSACYMWKNEYQAGLDCVAPLIGRCVCEPAHVRAAIYNNAALGLTMLKVGAAADDPQLFEAERLSAQSFGMYPCILEYRSTRALVLAARGYTEEACRLLDYPLFDTATRQQRAERELGMAFALHLQGKIAAAGTAAANALRLDPSVSGFVRSLGVRPDFTMKESSHSRSAKLVHKPVTFEQEPLGSVPSLLARIVGFVLSFIGAALAALAVWLAAKQHFAALLTSFGVVLGVIALIAAFCFTVGCRLMLYRPNRHGSLVSPIVWTLLAVVFASLGIVMGAATLASGRKFGDAVLGIVCSFALAGLCWKARESSNTRMT